MKIHFAGTACIAFLALGTTAAAALPLSPSMARPTATQGAEKPTLVHHKPGHTGGRGLHLGWYKANRGKHKGWRRSRKR